MDKIKILLVDDHTIVRKGLRSILEKESRIKIVGESEDGREAIKNAEALQPDIVLMDIAMPDLNGLEATRQLKKRYSEMKIIILSMHSNEEYVLQALQAGAAGYLIKKAAPAELISAILAVYRGDSFLSPSISRTVIDNYIQKVAEIQNTDENHEKLTNREREVLQLVAEGKKIKILLNYYT
jgi:DNA-binding NarL/FixJ family response regulator